MGWEKFVTASGADYDSDLNFGGRWPTGDETRLIAQVEGIPNGAELTQVLFYFFDNDAGPAFSGRFCRSWTDSERREFAGSELPRRCLE